jgi:hypothetical protein
MDPLIFNALCTHQTSTPRSRRWKRIAWGFFNTNVCYSGWFTFPFSVTFATSRKCCKWRDVQQILFWRAVTTGPLWLVKTEQRSHVSALIRRGPWWSSRLRMQRSYFPTRRDTIGGTVCTLHYNNNVFDADVREVHCVPCISYFNNQTIPENVLN